MDQIYEKSKDLSVNKPQSKKLKQEILDYYQESKDAIERAYINSAGMGA